MESMNPYEAPSAPVGPPAASPAESGQPFTRAMVDALKGTEPWVRLFGVLCLIGAGLMTLGGVAATAAFAFLPSDESFPAWLGLVYAVLGVLYLPPGVFLNRYAGAIARVRERGLAADVESALAHQKSFWKFVGISAVAMIGAWILVMVGVVAFAVVAKS